MSDPMPALDALYYVGHALLERDQAQEALSLFRTMLLVDATDERGWLALATCHERLEEPEKALAMCELAKRSCQAPIRCAIARARIHRATGAFEAAREAYEEASRLADARRDRDLYDLVAMEANV